MEPGEDGRMAVDLTAQTGKIVPVVREGEGATVHAVSMHSGGQAATTSTLA